LSGLSEPQHHRVSRDPDFTPNSTNDDRLRPAAVPLSAQLIERSTRAQFATPAEISCPALLGHWGA
jgi:hypothetical protein